MHLRGAHAPSRAALNFRRFRTSRKLRGPAFSPAPHWVDSRNDRRGIWRPSSQGGSHELFELDLIGDPLFTLGVPANAPPRFKQMVFAAGKTYVMGNRSVDYMLREYGALWNFDDSKKHDFSPLFLEVCSFVIAHVDQEIDRFMAIPKKDDHPGLFAAGSALMRLYSSFRSACLLLRQHYWVEMACILKLILEQLAWSYVVCRLEGKLFFARVPSKAVATYKTFYPTAGKLYGWLNEASHVSPERTIDYLDFSGKRPGVYLSSSFEAAKHAYFLVLLVDMFLVTSEFMHGYRYEKLLYTRTDQAGDVTLNPRRKVLKTIEQFRKRLNRLRKRHFRPKFKAHSG
jgi:hypothetical protein